MMNRERSVIIFKSESETNDEYAKELNRHHLNALFVPVITFGFKNLEKFYAKLQNPDDYSGLIFTSPRGIDAVVKSLQKCGSKLSGSWKMLHNYSVGEVTHNMALGELDQLFTHGKKSGNASALADFIIETFDGAKDLPFLLPCSNLAQDTMYVKLTEHGFRVDPIEVYETKPNPNLHQYLEKDLQTPNLQYLAFFSPSGVDTVSNYFKAKNLDLDKYLLVAIGPSTRRALENNGHKVYCTAERPTVEHLLKVLINPEECRERLRKDDYGVEEKLTNP